MIWVDRNSLDQYTLVSDFKELLSVFDCDEINEFFYERSSDENDWKMSLY